MKIKITILYKSGVQKEYISEVTEDELEKAAIDFSDVFQCDRGGSFSIPSESKRVIIIRMSDVSEITFEEAKP